MSNFNRACEQILREIFANIPGQSDGEFTEYTDKQEGTEHLFYKKEIPGKKGNHIYTYHAQIRDGKADVNFWMDEGTTEITGEGNAVPVLNAALFFLEKLVQKYSPQQIQFDALKKTDDRESASRGDVYAKLIARFASGRGYTSQREKGFSAMDRFVLTRQNHVA